MPSPTLIALLTAALSLSAALITLVTTLISATPRIREQRRLQGVGTTAPDTQRANPARKRRGRRR